MSDLDAQLFGVLARVAMQCANWQMLALVDTAWAFATAGQLDARLFAVLAVGAERGVIDCKPQELVKAAWASVTAAQSDSSLIEALAVAAEWRVGEFDPQHLANMAWLTGL